MHQKQHIELELRLPTAYRPADLESRLRQLVPGGTFASYLILKQSLDSRQQDIFWQLKVAVFFDELSREAYARSQELVIPVLKTAPRVVVVGSGPAGFFSALYLARAGCRVTLLEQGSPVETRQADIQRFEQGGHLLPFSNYAFGEGGAGTFSDGKLTSRTKNIVVEKNFVFQTYIQAGAPQEIAWLSKPHVGSDNLVPMMANLRALLQDCGVDIRFGQRVTDLVVRDGRIVAACTEQQELSADFVFVAPGHSANSTYRMLLARRVPFRAKPFALGVRMEHPQELINRAQWRSASVKGLKAAEYQVTHTTQEGIPVFSFCMCPGGTVVPASMRPGVNIVNGASVYRRDGPFANAALVAGINPADYFPPDVAPGSVLDWLESIEEAAFDAVGGTYRAPANTLGQFRAGKVATALPPSSYPFERVPADFDTLLPARAAQAIREAIPFLGRRIPGFEQGLMLGLETKTSAPIQVGREGEGWSGYPNLFIVGEGSGYAGGIVSSAVDGLTMARRLVERLR